MLRQVFRVCRARYARLDGEGARVVGGRWNSVGHPVVYMAESIALAVLENLVHLSRQDFPTGYVCVAATIPEEIVVMEESELLARARRSDWTRPELGDWWIDTRPSAVLKVASVVVPRECNYLLNPAHPDFARIRVEPPAIFQFDARLFPDDGQAAGGILRPSK